MLFRIYGFTELSTCYNNLTSKKKHLDMWTVQLQVLLNIDTDMVLRLIFGSKTSLLNSD